MAPAKPTSLPMLAARVPDVPLTSEPADETVALFRALGHPIRLELLRHVAARGPICTCHLEESLPYTQPLISKHLGILRRSGVLTSRREGKWVYYSLDFEALKSTGDWVAELLADARAPHLADHCEDPGA